MNNVSIIGRLTGAYELKYMPNGKPVGSFSIAVSDGWGDNEHTSFYNVSVFGEQAERHEKVLSKGFLVGITGSLRQDRYETNGEKKSIVKIIASRIDYLTPKKEAQESQDDMPF